MKTVSLFSGIGMASLACELHFNAETVAFVEQTPHCQKVLARHWPGVPIHDDVCKVGKHNLPEFDLLEAGFPCQDLSTAGKQAGLSGKRSGLFYEVIRITKECQPKLVFCENVPALLSKYHKVVEDAFEEIGYGVRWVRVSAAHVGTPHLRWRVFLLATKGGEHQGVTDAGDPPALTAWSTPRANSSDHHTSPTQIKRNTPGLAWEVQPMDAVKAAHDSAGVRWPTPNAGNFNDGQSWESYDARKAKLALTGQCISTPIAMAVQPPPNTKRWPTPTARDWKDGSSFTPNVEVDTLGREVVAPAGAPMQVGGEKTLAPGMRWTTPTSSRFGHSETTADAVVAARTDRPPNRLPLNEQIVWPSDGGLDTERWPTPRAGVPGSRAPGTGGRVLSEEVTRQGKPDFSYPDQEEGEEGEEGVQLSGRLNPVWVENLQGLPQGWTEAEGDSMLADGMANVTNTRWPAPMVKGLWGDSPQYDWEPPRTTADSIINKGARLKALGNGNPPQLYLKALQMLGEDLPGILGLFGGEG